LEPFTVRVKAPPPTSAEEGVMLLKTAGVLEVTAGTIARTRKLLVSPKYMLPPGPTVNHWGWFNCAMVASSPSPL
jgi:hypothetical protein